MFHMPSHIDRYEIKTLIGAGGMGSLYLARDTNPNTSRLVAVKLLLANLDSGDLRERFAREARALAALNHPNIVDIYDSGEFQGAPFIVMEYVRGETLGEKIKRRAPMTLGQKLKLMIELCSGLEHAHDAGIIHRDIKPANLMVDQHGRLKILDFGIARVSESLTRVGVQVTQLNMRIGTPGYMSPEQIEGGEIDRRSDVFAAGTVCYELLAYREAFTGASTRQVENKVLQTHPEPLSALLPDLDPEIERIIGRALAKDPADRYQTAAEVEQAFERLRWQLGPEPPLPAPAKLTPDPSLIPGRRSPRDSRADAAYQRSLALYADGAHDAARRFAVEALAEDPEHEEARTFVDRFGARGYPPAPPRTSHTTGDGPTVLRTGSHPADTVAAGAETVLSTASHPSRDVARGGAMPWWRRYGKSLQIAALAVAVATLTGGAILLGYWFFGSTGLVLTITKPEGGTLQARGIYCGTGGTDCSTRFASGSLVELRAQPDDGFVFGEFTGDCAPFGRMTITASQTCGATFNRIPEVPSVPGMLLSIDAPRGGTILGEGIQCGSLGTDCVMEHPQGKLIVLKALADQDYTFRGFTGDCHSRSGEAVMNTGRRCGAQFVQSRVAGPATPSPVPSAPAPRVPRSDAPSSTPATPDPLDGRITSPSSTPLPGGGEGTPPREALPPPPSAESIAREEIERLLNAYRVAYESLDVERIRRVYPGAPARNLTSAFRDYRSLEYTYTTPPEFIDIDPALGTATVKIGAQLKPEYRGPGRDPQKLINLFTLKRNSGVWTITDIKYPPK